MVPSLRAPPSAHLERRPAPDRPLETVILAILAEHPANATLGVVSRGNPATAPNGASIARTTKHESRRAALVTHADPEGRALLVVTTVTTATNEMHVVTVLDVPVRAVSVAIDPLHLDLDRAASTATTVSLGLIERHVPAPDRRGPRAGQHEVNVVTIEAVATLDANDRSTNTRTRRARDHREPDVTPDRGTVVQASLHAERDPSAAVAMNDRVANRHVPLSLVS